MTTQQWLWSADGAALAVALAAGIAESRRTRRRALHGHGWMPWRGLQMAVIFAMIALTIFAIKAG